MCRNIETLFNFDPPATDDEIRAASLQFVRKLSGFTNPSQVNEAAFNRAVSRGYLAKNPMKGWRWDHEDRKAIRVISPTEEAALLASAEALFGPRVRAFVFVALKTGGRGGGLNRGTQICCTRCMRSGKVSKVA